MVFICFYTFSPFFCLLFLVSFDSFGLSLEAFGDFVGLGGKEEPGGGRPGEGRPSRFAEAFQVGAKKMGFIFWGQRFF